MRPIEEINGLLAKGRAFCSSVPESDPRWLAVADVRNMCDAIEDIMAAFRLIPASHPSADECILKLRVALGLLGQHLAKLEALDLAMQIERAAAKMKVRARVASDAKQENAASLTRQIAALWNHEREQHPGRSSDAIGQEVRAKAKVSQKTLERHLARAREQGLIFKRR